MAGGNPRRSIASLLAQEPDIDHLSKQESDESTGRYLSYYENDLVVVDWDAALIIDEPRDFDENALHHGTRKPSARRTGSLRQNFGRLAGSRLSRFGGAPVEQGAGKSCVNFAKSGLISPVSAMSFPT